MTSASPVRYECNVRLEPASIRDLFASVGWSDEAAVPSPNLDRAFNQDAVTASAWDEDDLVGFVRGKVDGIYVFLCNLVVRREYQRQGIGPRLFEMITLQASAVPGIFAVVGLGASGQLEFYARYGLMAPPDVTVISNKPNL